MEALGIDLKLFIGQVVNFLILFTVLGLFLYKPILKMLDERRDKIADGLENAKKAEQKLIGVESKTRELMSNTEKEARSIITEAQKLAADSKNEILETAKTQSEKIIKTAHDEAETSKNKIVADAKKELADIVMLALDKIVKEELTKEDKKKLTEKAIKEI